ncbi:uncharacterized protein IL334_007675 [Kwoniella shivajii]|uniref:YDG domain-containing protein n=1 Tax=Kwoniella shivajii TaxID=564305 RepID=A0ABZ1DD92_9TREE|nr:hypothetical protein IL334_007675 [Kwoniella shivajii]
MSLSYEEQRIQNIKDNEALLLSLGLSAPVIPKAPTRKAVQKKKNDEENGSLKVESEKTPRSIRVRQSIIVESENGSPESNSSGLTRRRSSRARTRAGGLTINYKGDSPLWREDVPVQRRKRTRDENDGSDDDKDKEGDDWRQRKAQKLGTRTEDPKSFGHIPGVEVGTCWPTRMDCSTDAVHAPTVAGISGNAEVGAWSVALSGYAFTYTGSGGRDLKGTKTNPKNLRTAEQSYDQSFDNRFNAALKKSSETRKPVRVIRGFKLPSVYAPAEGYRYDGLYIVEKAWMAKGLTKGLRVCRYAFRRIEGQPELPVKVGDDEEEQEEEADEDVVEELKNVKEEKVDLVKLERQKDEAIHQGNSNDEKMDDTEQQQPEKEVQSANALGKMFKTFKSVMEAIIPTRSKESKPLVMAGEDEGMSESNIQRRTSLRRTTTRT